METNLEIVKTMHKHDLQKELGYPNRPTFLKAIKTLTTEPRCPFDYHDFKSCGHYVRGSWVKFIIHNL